MNLSLCFLIYNWNNTASANSFLLSTQGGVERGQSRHTFRKFSRWWRWRWPRQWDLSHGSRCTLCSSTDLRSCHPLIALTLWVHEYCVQAALLCITWTAVITSNIYVSDVWESCILQAWLMNSALLQHCPCGQLAFLFFHALLDAIPTAWSFSSNWQIAGRLLQPRWNVVSVLKASLIFIHRKLFLSLAFWAKASSVSFPAQRQTGSGGLFS